MYSFIDVNPVPLELPVELFGVVYWEGFLGWHTDGGRRVVEWIL